MSPFPNPPVRGPWHRLGYPRHMTSPAILRWPGSKWSSAPTIAGLLPPHNHYVEPFFGSGAVLLTKQPSRHEIVSDADDRIINFFRVLRDRTDDLIWAIETTPWSRTEYEHSDDAAADEVEAARRFFVRAWQAFASDQAKKTGWKNRGPSQNCAGMSHRWRKLPPQLAAVADRLRDVEIDNRDAMSVINRFNRPDVCIYADPPYLHSTRSQRMYRHEMDDQDHVALLDALDAHTGSVVLSGYASELYDDRLSGWQRHEFGAPRAEAGARRVEVCWVKHPD